MFVPFEPLEIEGQDGQIHRTWGCSLLGLHEFRQNLTQIQAIIDNLEEALPLAHLYQSDRQFRRLVNRCLELNNLNPAHLNPKMVAQLLFPYQFNNEVHQGLLVELNFPPTPHSQLRTSTPPTLAEQIAALSTHTASLNEALELANTVPYSSQLAHIAEAKRQLSLTPEQKEEERFQRWAAEERQKARGF